MKILRHFFVLGLLGVSANLLNAEQKTNSMGQPVWSQRSTAEIEEENTKSYNISAFESYLSELGYMEYIRLSPKQKQDARDLANKGQLSPDAAVFIMGTEF